MTEDVTHCDTSGDAATDTGGGDVAGVSKTNGDTTMTSCCMATVRGRVIGLIQLH